MKTCLLAGILVLLTIGAQAQENRLLKAEAALTLETVSNLHGGIDERTRSLENLDITFEIDTARWWEGGTVFVYFLGDHGADPTEYIGDMQASSNIEAYDTFKLYEAWYEQKWDQFALLFGLHDFNSEFYALDSASLFMGSSFGIGPDVSQVGPSIFPTTSAALRAVWNGDGGNFVRAAIYDGVPGDPDNEQGTQIIWKGDDGLFYALEAGRQTDAYKVALGAWLRTTDFVDYAGVQRRHNNGFYVIGECGVGGDQTVFLQLGKAQSDRNEIGSYIGAGWHCAKVFCEKGEAGLGVAHARTSSGYKRINNLRRDETALELTYAYTFSDYLSAQTSLHHIINPSMDPNIDDATVLALRITLSY